MNYRDIDALGTLKPNSEWSWIGQEYSGLNWLSSDTKPSESEINNEVARLNAAEPMRLLRVERDKRLTACDWRASTDLTMSTAWKTYRQKLRDLPAISSPKLNSQYELDLTSVTWPTEPS